MAMRVPVPNGSITEFTVNLEADVTAGDVNAAFETAAEGELEGVLGVTNDDIVSSDVLQQPYSTLVDLENTNVVGDMTKVLTWYDNEYGFSSRMLDVAQHVHEYQVSLSGLDFSSLFVAFCHGSGRVARAVERPNIGEGARQHCARDEERNGVSTAIGWGGAWLCCGWAEGARRSPSETKQGPQRGEDRSESEPSNALGAFGLFASTENRKPPVAGGRPVRCAPRLRLRCLLHRSSSSDRPLSSPPEPHSTTTPSPTDSFGRTLPHSSLASASSRHGGRDSARRTFV